MHQISTNSRISSSLKSLFYTRGPFVHFCRWIFVFIENNFAITFFFHEIQIMEFNLNMKFIKVYKVELVWTTHNWCIPARPCIRCISGQLALFSARHELSGQNWWHRFSGSIVFLWGWHARRTETLSANVYAIFPHSKKHESFCFNAFLYFFIIIFISVMLWQRNSPFGTH